MTRNDVGRAQSEVLGFIFVFSLLVLTTGLVFALGLPTVENARDAERVTNVERAFEVLDNNVDDMMRRNVPSRATEVKLAGGMLSIQESTTVRIHAEKKGNSSMNETFSGTTRPIVYSDDDTEIALSFGAVLRSDDGSSVMLSDPDWLVDDRAVVPYALLTRGDGTTIVAGETTVLVVGETKSRGVAGSFTTDDDTPVIVNVTVESSRADAWDRYMEEQGWEPIDDDPSDGNVTYQFEADELYVPRTTVQISFK